MTVLSKPEYLNLTEGLPYKTIPSQDNKKKKKKKRGKRGGKKHKRSSNPWYYTPKPKPPYSADLPEIGIHTYECEVPSVDWVKEFKPEFRWIDFADTPAVEISNRAFDGREHDVKKVNSDGSWVAKAYSVPIQEYIGVIREFLDWCARLPDDVIIYGNPRAHPLFQAFTQLMGVSGEACLRINLILFSHKGEDYHYLADGQNRAAVRKHLEGLNIEAPVESGAHVECGICCETFPTCDSEQVFARANTNCVSKCSSCGERLCGRCAHNFLIDQIKPEFIRENGRHKVILYKPRDGTCPYCRQGFWCASDRTHIPQATLRDIQNTVRVKNGLEPLEGQFAGDYIKEVFSKI